MPSVFLSRIKSSVAASHCGLGLLLLLQWGYVQFQGHKASFKENNGSTGAKLNLDLEIKIKARTFFMCA